jgi:hypothetical protein
MTVASLICCGQSADSVTIKKRLDRQIEAKKVHDSLEAIFYSIPPFFKITLEVNHEKATIPDNSKFYATDGRNIFEPKKSDIDQYEFGDLPDSVKFALAFDTIKIETGFIKEKFYKNGAGLRFGYFDNVLELKRQWDKRKKDEDFDEWIEIREPYLTAVKDKKIIAAAKKGKIRPIEFVAFAPRVYGDGVIHTFRNIRLK